MTLNTKFPVGAKVRLKPEFLNHYDNDHAHRAADGRIGVVTGHTFPYGNPQVTLPGNGQKAEYHWGQIVPTHWEVVAD